MHGLVCGTFFSQKNAYIFLFFHNEITHIFLPKNADIFLFLDENLPCWYILEMPQGGTSNKYQQDSFLDENLWYLVGTYYKYLREALLISTNKTVFLMKTYLVGTY